MSVKPHIDVIWKRLIEHESEEFHTITGLPFTYTINGSSFQTSRNKKKYNINKSNFTTALEYVPYTGPGILNTVVRGPAYIWAVLHDKRIRRNDW